MVSRNPKAAPVPKPSKEITGRFERASYLGRAFRLNDELARASGVREKVDDDLGAKEPKEPSPAMQRRLAKAIDECCRDIQNEKARETKHRVILSPHEAEAVQRVLETGASYAETAFVFEISIDTVRKIARGEWEPKRAKIRCAGCGAALVERRQCLVCSLDRKRREKRMPAAAVETPPNHGRGSRAKPRSDALKSAD